MTLEELAQIICDARSDHGLCKVDVGDRNAALAVARRVLEEAAKLVGEPRNAHCCEDCPCSSWEEDTAALIRSLLASLTA